MTALDIDRPDFLKDEDVAIFAQSVEKFLDESCAARSASNPGGATGSSNGRSGARRARRAFCALPFPRPTAVPAAISATRSW